ncbi:hypothetical protein [uncultured Phascolarctobacterium sp.]|uniref:hypothetical protein n=1 Tax=Phascolarctobacterium sp. TaxID=2049039 RepID=UPI0025D688E0|nr:hypothetical protein [uncultured Phascolarctobacterium sp.]
MQAIEKKYCGEYKIGEFYEGTVKTNKKPIPLTAVIYIINDREKNELVLGNYLVCEGGETGSSLFDTEQFSEKSFYKVSASRIKSEASDEPLNVGLKVKLHFRRKNYAEFLITELNEKKLDC